MTALPDSLPDGGIIWKMPRQCVPDFLNRLDYTPAGLDHIRSLKECLIPQHAIMQQTLLTEEFAD